MAERKKRENEDQPTIQMESDEAFASADDVSGPVVAVEAP